MIRSTGHPGGAGRREPPRGPEAASEVLRRLLRDLRIEERSRQGELASAWDRAAGADLSSRARPVAFRGGVLTVEVEGAGLLHEVRGFRAGAILEALRAEPGGAVVREIRWVPAGRAGGAAGGGGGEGRGGTR